MGLGIFVTAGNTGSSQSSLGANARGRVLSKSVGGSTVLLRYEAKHY